MNFGERLRHAREDIAKLTQKQLEELSGVSQKTISKLELGNQDGSTAVVQLAVACGVRPEWLAMADGEPVASHPVEHPALPPDGVAAGSIESRPRATSPMAQALIDRIAALDQAHMSPPALYALIENALDLVQPRASGTGYAGLDDLPTE